MNHWTEILAERFDQLRSGGRAGLLPFVTAGDPSLAFTEKAIRSLDRRGVVAIEIGVPFSDPLADGPTIQKSSERALTKGVTLRDTLAMVERLTATIDTPLVLMSYFNPILRFGLERFAAQARRAGVSAVLPTDLPVEESEEFRSAMKAGGIGTVFLAAPTSSNERVDAIAGYSTGFTYYVSLTGVTGARRDLSTGLVSRLKTVRRLVSGPLAVGFGVSKPDHVKRLAPHCDAVVVGSAVVRAIEGEKTDAARLAALDSLVESLIRPLLASSGRGR